MTVAWILRDKGRHVVSVLPGTPVNEAIALLEKSRIGAVVVVDEWYRVIGILSERDIVRLLATRGVGALSEPVSHHMTHPVSTCSEHHSIDWVMNEMTNHRFRHIPVTDNERLVGIVSIGDVVKLKLALEEAEAVQMRQYFSAGDKQEGINRTYELDLEYSTLKELSENLVLNDNKPSQTDDKRDFVEVSVFSQPVIMANLSCVIQIHFHLFSEILKVAKKAMQIDPESNRLTSSTLRTAISKGSNVEVFVESNILQVLKPFQEITWKGAHVFLEFPVITKQGQTAETAKVTVHIGLNGVEIGLIEFELPIKENEVKRKRRLGILSTEIESKNDDIHLVDAKAKKYGYAFISYSREDFTEASLFAQGLEENEIKVCVDVTTFEPGDDWEKEIAKNISKADAFFLIWSDNAAQSKWVTLETREAVQLYDSTVPPRPAIKPIVISRPVPAPPDFLKRFHFDLKWLAHRTAQKKPLFQDGPSPA